MPHLLSICCMFQPESGNFLDTQVSCSTVLRDINTLLFHLLNSRIVCCIVCCLSRIIYCIVNPYAVFNHVIFCSLEPSAAWLNHLLLGYLNCSTLKSFAAHLVLDIEVSSSASLPIHLLRVLVICCILQWASEHSKSSVASPNQLLPSKIHLARSRIICCMLGPSAARSDNLLQVQNHLLHTLFLTLECIDLLCIWRISFL